MKKGTKTLVALLLGCSMAMAGCSLFQKLKPSEQESTTTESSGSSEQTQYTVAINNKDALQAEWPANGGGRKVELTVEPRANIAQLINEGTIKIASDNTNVLTISGQMAMPVGAGSAKITVTCGESSDEVSVTISEALTIKTKYNVEHEGTEDDPLTNEEALSVAKNPLYNEDGGHEDLHVRGIVEHFYHAPGARTDGAVSWFLEPAQPGGEQFEIYKCYKTGTGEASYLTDADIWVGADVLAHGRFTVYNGQYETDGAKFVRSWGEPPAPREVVVKTFEEALADVKALGDGADTYDYYQVDAYVTKKSGTNYFLTATRGEAIETESDNTIELYGATAEGLADMLTKDAKVRITMVLKNYHGQVENLLPIDPQQIDVLEEGGSWDIIPEPAVVEGTLAEFIANTDGNYKKAYHLSAEVKSFKNGGTTNDKYGNLVLTDGENDLIVYGSTATADALAWNNTDAYTFTNPQDFQTNATTSAIAIGDTVEMKIVRCDYQTTIEGCGIILSVTPGEGGGQEDVPEPDVVEGTLAEFIANTDGNYKVAYHLSAEVKSFKNGGQTNDQYGNLVLTDGENDLIVYGSTATASALTWDNVSSYAFDNPKDFQTNETTSAIAIGDTVEMKIVRCDYKTTIEGCGIILSVTPGTPVIPDENVRTLKYTGATTTNMAATGNAELVNLDPTEFEVDADKGETTNFPGLNKAGDIRLYSLKSNEAVGNGSNFTVTYLQGTIESIKIDFKQSPGDCVVSVGGEEVEGTEGVYEIAATSFNVKNGYVSDGSANTQVQINKIEITVAEGTGPVDPVVLPQPVGAFSGYMTAEGVNVFTHVALGNEAASVEIYFAQDNANNFKGQMTYTYDSETGLVTIALGGNYGNFTATYDPEQNALVNAGIDGVAAALLTNNGEATLQGATKFWNCDGTTEELRAQFIRRYRANGASGWTVDNNEEHTDRIASDTTNFVGGTGAMSIRPYPGNGNAIGLSLKDDFAEKTTFKNIGFWVYNSSDTDIVLRTWVFQQTGLSGAAEIGNMTAKANGWTYCRMGFNYGMYNFNVSNWNGSSNALVFDNIALF